VTIMVLDEGMDSGPILAQRRIPISPKDTTESLEAALAEMGAVLLTETLPKWFKHDLAPQPQREQDATYTKQISKQDGKIDWRLPASELERRVRALHPWPGCYTHWQGKTLKVLEAVSFARKTDGIEEKPGTIVAIPDDLGAPFGVVTGDGILGLRRVQLEGKKAVLATEFLRGQRQFIGQTLGSA
ncbi:MAG: methionyl-tRNA formyltransferase, partial [Chloroflexi bacterium]|nr:methionyl-tRNA formyltransferase [Chloroflexota bacterium]